MFARLGNLMLEDRLVKRSDPVCIPRTESSFMPLPNLYKTKTWKYLGLNHVHPPLLNTSLHLSIKSRVQVKQHQLFISLRRMTDLRS